MIKLLGKPEIERNFLNLIKRIYKKSAADILLKSEKVNVFSPRLGTRQ